MPVRQAARLSLGIIVVGLGLALMTIISVAGEAADSRHRHRRRHRDPRRLRSSSAAFVVRPESRIRPFSPPPAVNAA